MHRHRIAIVCLVACCVAVAAPPAARAQTGPTSAAHGASIPRIHVTFDDGEGRHELSLGLRLIFGLALITLAPALIMTMTCFTRIIIVLSFLRSALGTQQSPPTPVLTGFALFLTYFVMFPTWTAIKHDAIQPYSEGTIRYEDAIAAGARPLRRFMLAQTREKDLALFVRLAELPRPRTADDVPFHVLVPAFVLSELKSAFQIGFVLYIPFLIVDLVVASALMSVGMLMLPPVMVSLPIKILLFVMVDGWHLITRALVVSFL
ncbi:MAG: flagellar type III secretion system pore protein FliP [Armatimonadota bacterium]